MRVRRKTWKLVSSYFRGLNTKKQVRTLTSLWFCSSFAKLSSCLPCWAAFIHNQKSVRNKAELHLRLNNHKKSRANLSNIIPKVWKPTGSSPLCKPIRRAGRSECRRQDWQLCSPCSQDQLNLVPGLAPKHTNGVRASFNVKCCASHRNQQLMIYLNPIFTRSEVLGAER